MIRKIILMIAVVGMGCALAAEEKATPLSAKERKEFEDLGKKTPPQEKEKEFDSLKNEHESLKARLANLNDVENTLVNTDIKLLDGDIDFFKGKIKRLESNRTEITRCIYNTRRQVNQFNQAVMEYVGDRLNRKSYLILGVPAFKRQNVYKHPDASAKLLVVNLDHPAEDDVYVVGGEIVTTASGNAQFVVLHKKDNDTYSLERAGSAIDITYADKQTGGDFFNKTVVFSDNFVELHAGDKWGVVIDSAAGITYDGFGAGSSYVTAFKETDSIKWSEENVQGENSFSFNLFVQTIDKE